MVPILCSFDWIDICYITFLFNQLCGDLFPTSQIAKFMGPTWGPPGSCRPQMGPMLTQWTLVSGYLTFAFSVNGQDWDCTDSSIPSPWKTRAWWYYLIKTLVAGEAKASKFMMLTYILAWMDSSWSDTYPTMALVNFWHPHVFSEA